MSYTGVVDLFDTDGKIKVDKLPTSGGNIDIGVVVDGGGSVLTTGIKGYRNISASYTITGYTIISDITGSCVVDVKKTTYATFPTSTSIVGADKPTLSNAVKNQQLTLTAWTTTLIAGDILEFNIESVSTIKKLYLYIHLKQN